MWRPRSLFAQAPPGAPRSPGNPGQADRTRARTSVRAAGQPEQRLAMDTTSVSLLERLRRPGAHEAWARFVHLYTPLLYYWARRLGLREEDAADLVQDVFTV